MPIYKDTVDRISNTIKSLNKDDRTSKRYILKVFQDKLSFLIAQKLSDRSLFREDVFTDINCIEMEKIDVVSCPIVEFRTCNTVMKSVCKLPKVINNRFGPAIVEVTNIDGSVEYKKTTPQKYRNSKKRKEPKQFKDYYVREGYLYMPDSNIETVRATVLTLESYNANLCNDSDSSDCKSNWEYEIPSSDKITEVAVQETLKELGLNRQIVEDTNPNMDPNSKGKEIA